MQFSQGLTEGPVLPRKRKIPRRVNDGADPHQYATPKDLFRQQYFQVLDVVTNELSRRFDQQDLKTVVEMEKKKCFCQPVIVNQIRKFSFHN